MILDEADLVLAFLAPLVGWGVPGFFIPFGDQIGACTDRDVGGVEGEVGEEGSILVLFDEGDGVVTDAVGFFGVIGAFLGARFGSGGSAGIGGETLILGQEAFVAQVPLA